MRVPGLAVGLRLRGAWDRSAAEHRVDGGAQRGAEGCRKEVGRQVCVARQ